MSRSCCCFLACTLIAVSACGRDLESRSFGIDLSFEVPPMIVTGELDEEIIVDFSTEVTDLEALRDELPIGTAAIVEVEFHDLAIGSPRIAPIGTWVSSLALYASQDRFLSPRDLLLGEFELAEPREEVVMALGPEVDELVDGDSIALVMHVGLRGLPEYPIEVPVTITGVALVQPL